MTKSQSRSTSVVSRPTSFWSVFKNRKLFDLFHQFRLNIFQRTLSRLDWKRWPEWIFIRNYRQKGYLPYFFGDTYDQQFESKTDVTRIRRNRRLMRQRAMEAMTGDSHIDRVSRVMFPLTFFLFNVVYWFAYLSHRQAEIVHNTVDHKNDHN